LFNVDNERRHQIKARQKVRKDDGQRRLKVAKEMVRKKEVSEEKHFFFLQYHSLEKS
jgi:hypothetical protein